MFVLSSFDSQWFLRPTQELTVLRRRQEVIRFFSLPRHSDVLKTLQASLRNIKNIPVMFSPSIPPYHDSSPNHINNLN